ncbi:hypothetical protein N836_03805 [Leptolyngbya sp. Heron Island J]|uniref:nSTAND1 domain-containing NTPase n=1 Tax=Leptolyngbya sp. Heron Island J TaxID=1385935 RepID=UPI0003B9622E|nr:ATP-binding protein [Leptolyngbya sp. Heron Island J]ESA37232.1 hypothetical protein N836_03805 [Leptolyngbya sp. Heron Island J]
MSGTPFSGDFFKQSTEAIVGFIRWIAELIVSKNWLKLCILVAFTIACLFNPWSGIAFKVLSVDVATLPDWYKGAFWATELGLFATALVIAVQSIPKTTVFAQPDTIERKAIKGLRPFSLGDAEVYAQLQRHRQLRDCVDSLTSNFFRFGILMGESGCGKTSFLQAGVLPRLMAETSNCLGVYIRFNDQRPTRTIAKALSEQLNVPLGTLLEGAQEPLLVVLQQASASQEKPLVLLFDQFEQFFVHQRRQEDREPFIHQLVAWYRDPEPLPVKILVSIRSDMLHQLNALHQALGYALGPQEVFQLEKFTPREAANVLEVIAQTEGLEFNKRFVTELAEEELANREDGLISPVDVQILAWMIERQTADELRAFNQNAFQKFGGVEGLLTRFLERTLDARVIPSQRQSAVKVLLALTDLDSQVRAGVLTVPMLKDTLRATVKAEDVTEAVTWLARGDVRLVTPQEQDGQTGYELAHERLIPALMRLAGKELSDVDKANQLLDRRVNEWLGNDCSRRYLFGMRELWQLERQRPYLVWGSKRQQKQRLMQLSQQQLYRGSLALALVVLIGVSGSGWVYWTPQGQIWNAKRQLMGLLDDISTTRMTEAAVAFAKNNEWRKVERIIKKLSNEGENKARDAELAAIIRDIAAFLPMTDENNSTVTLSRLRGFSKIIKDNGARSKALSAIAYAYGSLGDKLLAKELLYNAIAATRDIQNNVSKSEVLSAIAYAYGSLGDELLAKELLQDAIAVTRDIQNNVSKSKVLSEIANVTSRLVDKPLAKEVLLDAIAVIETSKDDWSKTTGLSKIANATSSLLDKLLAKEVLFDAITAAQDIQSDVSKSMVLSEIANAISRLGDEQTAKEPLLDVIAAAQDIQDDESKSIALSAISSTYSSLGNEQTAEEVLRNAINTAQNIQNEWYKSRTLREIINVTGKLANEQIANEVLRDVITTVQNIQGDWSRTYALSAISNTYSSLGDKQMAQNVLLDAIAAAQDIQDNESKSIALIEISDIYSGLGDKQTAKQVLLNAVAVAKNVQENGSKSDILHAIVARLSETVDTALLEELLRFAREENANRPMVTIATYYAKREQWGKAVNALRKAEPTGKAFGLTQIITVLAEEKNPKLIEGPIVLKVDTQPGKQPGQYSVKTTIQTPDKSCEQRTDWWEVTNLEGELKENGRRILTGFNDNVQEPLADTIQGLNIQPDEEIIIRAHFSGIYLSVRDPLSNEMSWIQKSGYTDQAMRGSINDGFHTIRISENFAKHLETQEPLPEADACQES